jgi:hypothetical protein
LPAAVFLSTPYKIETSCPHITFRLYAKFATPCSYLLPSTPCCPNYIPDKELVNPYYSMLPPITPCYDEKLMSYLITYCPF